MRRFSRFTAAGAGAIFLVAAAVATSAPAPANARNWPQWRGPEFTGVAPFGTPPLQWSEDHNVAWKVEIPGNGFASPVVWGDQIFVLSAVPAGEDTPLAIAASTGDGADDPANFTVSLTEEGSTATTGDATSGTVSRSTRTVTTTDDGKKVITFAMSPPERTATTTGGDAAAVSATGDDASRQAVAAATEEAPQRQRRQRRSAPAPSLDYTVMAFDRADGSLRWSRVARTETPHEGKQNNNSWASASAITDGEHVFAFFGSRGLYAYDIDGNPAWDVDFGDMRIRNGFGEGATPVLHGDKLVVVWDHQGDSFIAALDKSTGEELWRQQRDEPDTWATPLVVPVEGGAQVITAGQNRTYGYDLESGAPIWDGPGLTVNPIPSPVYADGVVYLTSGYRGEALRAVRLSAAQGAIDDSAAILWEHNRDTPYVPSPVLYNGMLLFLKSNSPILTAVDIATGAVVYGPQRLDGLQEVYSSLVAADGRVYIVDRDGGGMVIDAGREFEVLATNSLDDGFEASPALVDGEMYLRGRRFLYRIEDLGGADR